MISIPLNRLRSAFCTALFVVALTTLNACGASSTESSGSWADMMQIAGRTYQLSIVDNQRATLQPADIGPAYSTIRSQVAGHTEPEYILKDGDATFLKAGTVVYEVKGYAPTFRLAAKRDEQFLLFEVLNNPMTQQGAILLDIAGKVQTIIIRGDTDGAPEVARVTDIQQVDKLVNLLVQAPVDKDARATGEHLYILEFQLKDGTAVTRVYNLESNLLAGGIMPAPEFQSGIEQALRKD